VLRLCRNTENRDQILNVKNFLVALPHHKKQRITVCFAKSPM